MKTEYNVGTDGSAIVRTGDIETVIPAGPGNLTAIGDLHNQIIRQRGAIIRQREAAEFAQRQKGGA